MQGDVQLLNYVVLFWGILVSLIEERFGKFQDMSPNMKQLVNAIATYLVPAIAVWAVNPWWQADWGDSTQFVQAVFIFLVPAFVWGLSQLTHLFDATAKRIREYVKDQSK